MLPPPGISALSAAGADSGAVEAGGAGPEGSPSMAGLALASALVPPSGVEEESESQPESGVGGSARVREYGDYGAGTTTTTHLGGGASGGHSRGIIDGATGIGDEHGEGTGGADSMGMQEMREESGGEGEGEGEDEDGDEDAGFRDGVAPPAEGTLAQLLT